MVSHTRENVIYLQMCPEQAGLRKFKDVGHPRIQLIQQFRRLLVVSHTHDE